MSGPLAAASAASAASASHGAAPAGDGDAMDEGASEVAANAAAVARARKTSAATAAAAAACAALSAAATGPYHQMHSSQQVLLLGDSELWDTVAENWCKPGQEIIQDIVATWEGRDLAACVYKLGLPVLYARKNYVQNMRRSVIDAVRAYARSHPELFSAGASQEEARLWSGVAERERAPSPSPCHQPTAASAVQPPPQTPPHGVIPAASLGMQPPLSTFARLFAFCGCHGFRGASCPTRCQQCTRTSGPLTVRLPSSCKAC